jgi:hypothetical protein
MTMTRMTMTIAAGFVAAATLVASAMPGFSAAFYGWRVNNVASWAVLNVRADASSSSQILVGYPNGTPLSLTGRCTGGLDLATISGWPDWQQRQEVRYRWCEVWVDPYGDGSFRGAWVYGRYITPL